MAWKCYMVEFCPQEPSFWRLLNPDNPPWFEVSGVKPLQWADLAPGAMWWDGGDLNVKLPSGSEWNIDRGRIHNATNPANRLPAWTRTGEPPLVTANPSINHVGQYHGLLRDGMLTDDCEGRTF